MSNKKRGRPPKAPQYTPEIEAPAVVGLLGGNKPLESSAEPVVEENQCADSTPQVSEPVQVKEDQSVADQVRRSREVRERRRSLQRHSGGLFRQKLAAPHRPGFRRRWVNETNIHTMTANGYAFSGNSVPDDENILTDSEGRKVQIVNNGGDAKAKRAFLMEIHEDLYQEDQVEKEARRTKMEAIVRGVELNDGIGAGDNRSKMYNPSPSSNQFDLE